MISLSLFWKDVKQNNGIFFDFATDNTHFANIIAQGGFVAYKNTANSKELAAISNSLVIFAGLIADCARSLASGLARCLAFAAAAFFNSRL